MIVFGFFANFNGGKNWDTEGLSRKMRRLGRQFKANKNLYYRDAFEGRNEAKNITRQFYTPYPRRNVMCSLPSF